MIVSALLPSRGRYELLQRSIRSLFTMANNVNDVEVLVAVDPDDERTALTASVEGALSWVTPERFGYERFNQYFNGLAERAKGDWLLLWNDDAVMQTAGWEQEMASKPPGVLCLHGNHDPFNAFPAMHRLVYEAMGHFSHHRANDSWVHDVGAGAECLHQTGIKVFHDRYDLTGNNNDFIYQATSANYATAEYYGPAMTALRNRDIYKVKEALRAHSSLH